MRTKFLLSGLLASVFLLGTFATVWAQTEDLKLTGCLTKKGKFRRMEFGNEPRKDCKNNQTPFMIPLTAKTDDLMDKDMELMDKDASQDVDIAQNAADIGTNAGLIGANAADIDALEAKDMELMDKDAEQDGRIDNNEAVSQDNAEDIATNADMINSIKTELISSMWGGGQRGSDDGPVEFYMPIFDMFFCEDREDCESKVAVSGKLDKFVAYQTEDTGEEDIIQYNVVVNGETGETPLGCDIADDQVMCESSIEGCVDVVMGDFVAVRASGDARRPVRWTARFVEGGACPRPDFCETFECPENFTRTDCDSETQVVTCERTNGGDDACFVGEEVCGDALAQCSNLFDPQSFTCAFEPL